MVDTQPLRPYARSLDDELDWKLLDQLYGVVSQISGFCFEIKKFCVTTEFVALTLLAKFTTDKLDHSLFVAGLLIPVCFWFLDAVGYYYQVKLRATMEAIRTRISDRNSQQIISANRIPVISAKRTERNWYLKVFDAAINHSMWLYGFIVTIDLITWALYIGHRIS